MKNPILTSLLGIACATSAQADEFPTKGMIGSFPFDGDSKELLGKDISGKANHGKFKVSPVNQREVKWRLTPYGTDRWGRKNSCYSLNQYHIMKEGALVLPVNINPE